MNNKKIARYVIIGVIALFLIVTVISSFSVVPTGHTGVTVTLGEVSDNTSQAGMVFKAPFVSKIVMIDNRTMKIEADCATSSKDLQTVQCKVAVNYRVNADASANLFKNVGTAYESVIIAPAVQESVKSVTAKFSAEELITKREDVSTQIKDELSSKILPYGISVDVFNVLNLDFSEEFNNAIEAKQTAQQQALKAEQDLNRIKIEAQQQVEQAKAEAEATRAKADAEAYAIQKIQEQLSKDPNYIEYKKVEKWDGKLPQVNGSGSPIIDLRDNTNTNQEQAG